MKSLIPAVLLSVAIGGGITYVLTKQTKDELETKLEAERQRLAAVVESIVLFDTEDPEKGYILISRSGDANRCVSTTTGHLSAYRRKKLKWTLNVVDSSCVSDGRRVQIRFKGASPTDPERPDSGGRRHIDARVKADQVNGHNDYDVWMLDAAGNDLFKMEDPELEIVDPPTIVKLPPL